MRISAIVVQLYAMINGSPDCEERFHSVQARIEDLQSPAEVNFIGCLVRAHGRGRKVAGLQSNWSRRESGGVAGVDQRARAPVGRPLPPRPCHPQSPRSAVHDGLLSHDVHWTSVLGPAFLRQQVITPSARVARSLLTRPDFSHQIVRRARMSRTIQIPPELRIGSLSP